MHRASGQSGGSKTLMKVTKLEDRGERPGEEE